jgi:hypothetical protein
MSMTALLGLAVTPRVNESRLSVSRTVPEWRFHTEMERTHNMYACVFVHVYTRIISSARAVALYYANNAGYIGSRIS